MAYQLFRLPKAVGLDSAVRALSGARAYFYETGTTTPQDTYSDADLTTPNANPVVADSAGVFPPIYLDPSLEYKLTLNTSSDALIYTVDPVNDQILSAESIGLALYPRTAAEIAAGVTPTDYSIPSHDGASVIHPERYGLTSADTTGSTNHAAITAAISVARQLGGGTVLLSSGEYKIDNQILMYDGVWLVGVSGGSGNSATGSNLRYIGTTFQDVIAGADSSQDDNIKILDIGIYGGEFQEGKARYGIYFDEFHRNCEVARVKIRDCLGCIKIVSGYYGSVHHNIWRRVTPAQGTFTDDQFEEVFGSDSAPVFLGEMNGCDCQHNVMDTLISEADTADQPTQAIYVSGSPVDCRYWIVEETGIAYDDFSPTVDYIIHTQGHCNFSGLYVEAVDFDERFIYASGEALTRLEDFFIFNVEGLDLFYNHAMGDMLIDNGFVYAANINRAWFANVNNLGVGGDVIFGDNVHWRAGERLTDATVNSDSNNVNDTNGTDYPYGAADGTVNRFHYQRLIFPRIVTGLTVTNDSDANGEYIQITGGVLLSERGKYINTKFRTGSFPASLNDSVQRLRPTEASMNYRVYVGRAGNIHLVESESAFTNAFGDWIASFDTDSNGDIQNLAANPRLSMRGEYLGATSNAVVYTTAAPTTGAWLRGDQAINTEPSASGAPGWVCVTAGSPGTWKARGNVAS